MRFSSSFLDEIRAKVPISEIVGARVRFDPKKSNAARGDYWGCCPFHSEKTASFHCDDRRGTYHCFGCGASGDVFRFLTESDRLAFHEAVEVLAGKAGLPMPKPDAAAAQQEEARANLYDIMEMAARFFEKTLHESASAEAASARAYLQERQIGLAAQKQFRLGYAPAGGQTLRSFLQQKNADKALLERSGLFAEAQDGGAPYDRFRSRIIFPIADIKGRVIAFGGRALSAQARAKYLNSPETELFHKGRIVYNLAQARQAMRSGAAGGREADRPLLVAEGYVDVVALAQAGIGEAVAPLGTALTEEQLGLLWRYCPQPILCFDGDKAGIQAAYRALDRALPLLTAGQSLQFMLLPEGQDPDDIIRQGGRRQFEALLADAAPLADILWQRETEGRSFSTPESRASLQKRLQDAAAVIKDSGLRYYYQRDMKERLWNYFRAAAAPMRGRSSQSSGFSGGRLSAGAFSGAAGGSLVTKSLADSALVRRASDKSGKGGYAPRETAILALLATYPALWHENFDVLAGLEFHNAELRALHAAMLGILAESGAQPEATAAEACAVMRQRLEQKGQAAILDKITAFAAKLGVKTAADSVLPPAAREALKQALTLYRRAHSLHKQIREIEADLLDNAANRDFGGDFARLLALREELRQTEDLAAAPDDMTL